MSDADRERWNARYESGEYAARTHPSALLAAWTGRLPRGRALDVACGRGRNAIHLAANGYAVDAMDISGVALAKARETPRASRSTGSSPTSSSRTSLATRTTSSSSRGSWIGP